MKEKLKEIVHNTFLNNPTDGAGDLQGFSREDLFMALAEAYEAGFEKGVESITRFQKMNEM